MSMDRALHLADQGYRVFPVRENKAPLVTAWPERATTDPEKVRAMWAKDLDAGVGIATGDGLVVVDLDQHKSDGVRVFTDWAEENGVEWTPTTMTRTKQGQHLYYRTSGSYKSGNGILTGVDFKSERAYVVAYDDVPDLEALPTLPEPIAQLIGSKAESSSASSREITPAGVKVAVDRELFKVELAPEGRRNDVLNSAAYSLGQLVGDHLDEDEIRDRLIDAAGVAGLDHHEAFETVASGLDSGKSNPRTVVDESRVELGAWTPVDFAELKAQGLKPIEPTLLARTDGLRLLYPGLTHSISGESGSGKSWLAQWASAEALNDGHEVLYLDYESSAIEVAQRLLILGCSWEVIEASFTYVNPDDAPHGEEFEALLARRYGLVIVDGVTEALGLSGIAGDNLTNSNDAVTKWHKMLPKRFAVETGAAVVQIDHVTKSKDNRGSYAIGGQAKRASITGASYTVQPKESFGRGRSGSFDLYVGKDRPGAVLASHGGEDTVSGRHIARVDVLSSDDRVRLELKAPGATSGDRLEAMKLKISAFLETLPKEHLGASGAMIRREVGGKTALIDEAVKELVGGGYVVREPRGQSMLHRLAKPYIDVEDLL